MVPSTQYIHVHFPLVLASQHVALELPPRHGANARCEKTLVATHDYVRPLNTACRGWAHVYVRQLNTACRGGAHVLIKTELNCGREKIS